MENFLSELSKQAFIWLQLGGWLALMIWIHHAPVAQTPRQKIPAPYFYWPVAGLLMVNAIASVIRVCVVHG